MADQTKIETSPQEMVTGRDFRRNFAGRMEQLESGDVDKLVLMRHGKMVGVVLTVERYAGLTAEGKG
jgi:hypothetical protein